MENNQKIKIKWPLKGNQHIVDYLEKSIENDNLGSTYIFSGPDNLGKSTLARYFSQILLCQNRLEKKVEACGICLSCQQFKEKGTESNELELHGDFYLLKKNKEKKNISISEIREFIKKLSLSSMLGGKKIGVIKHADALSIEAANALLKTLEEPQKDVLIIMIASNLSKLPSTIKSRSQILQFRPCPTETIHDYLVNEHKLPRSQAKNYSRLALGRPALAVKFFEDEEFRDFYKTRMVAFINFFKQDINRRLITVADFLDADKKGQAAVKKTERMLEIWQGLLRDFLLMKNVLPHLLQHEIVKNEIENTANRLSTQDILQGLKNIESAKLDLRANVNPRLVLENVVINII